MNQLFNTFSFGLCFFLAVLSIALRSELIIYKLDSLESQPSGIIKNIQLNNLESLSDISVSVWIQLKYIGFFKEILEMKVVTDNLNYSNNSYEDTIFSLQYLNWGTSKLKCGCYINNQEEQSTFDLSTEMNHSWLFVYLGHSFEKSKQTYFLYNQFIQKLLTKSVGKLENVKLCQISTGVGQYDGKEYFYGKIERLKVQTGQGAYKESDFADLYSVHPDNFTGCAIGYDQCGYIGQPFELCGGLKKPKSVLLQGMDSVTICANHREIKVMRDIDCIEEGDLISLHMAYAIDFSDNPNDPCEKN